MVVTTVEVGITTEYNNIFQIVFFAGRNIPVETQCHIIVYAVLIRKTWAT